MVGIDYNILTTEGYFARFYWHLQNGCRFHIDAYRAVENELSNIGAPSKYADYSSFRRNKSYHLKRLGRI